MQKIRLLVLLLALSSFTAIHKFYVSVTEIEYNPKEESLQIISRIFIDDLENVLQKRFDKNIKLGLASETPKATDHLEKYFEAKFEVSVDGKPVKLNYLGKEYEDDMILLYVEVPNVKSFRKIQIKNTVLMDLFPEQKNLVHVEHKGKVKSLILADGKEEDNLSF